MCTLYRAVSLISLLYERPVIGGTFVRLATRCPDRFGGIGEKGLGSLPFYYAYPSVINIWNSGLEDDYNVKLKFQPEGLYKCVCIIIIAAASSLTYPPKACHLTVAHGEQC